MTPSRSNQRTPARRPVCRVIVRAALTVTVLMIALSWSEPTVAAQPGVPMDVPATSTWGMVIMRLLLATTGTILFRSRVVRGTG